MGHEHRFTLLQLLSLIKTISVIHDNIEDAEYIKPCFKNWHLDQLKESWDDNTCQDIHKKCHYESYHNHLKYNLTLNKYGF